MIGVVFVGLKIRRIWRHCKIFRIQTKLHYVVCVYDTATIAFKLFRRCYFTHLTVNCGEFLSYETIVHIAHILRGLKFVISSRCTTISRMQFYMDTALNIARLRMHTLKLHRTYELRLMWRSSKNYILW